MLKAKTRKVVSRVAAALRLAAQSLRNSEHQLGEDGRRMKARLGKAEGITATAHQLARILHSLVKHRAASDASVFVDEKDLHRPPREKTLRKPAFSASHSPRSRVTSYLVSEEATVDAWLRS